MTRFLNFAAGVLALSGALLALTVAASEIERILYRFTHTW